jgi:probable F420-dependent oxidoreductase
MTRGTRVGIVVPNTEIGTDPDDVRAWAQAAEEVGFAHILAFDHVLGAVHEDREPPLGGPYTEETPFHEPLVLFGYLAGLTRTIELATGIIILPQRQVALVAKQAAEVDLLSRERLRFGVGSGWNYVEYESLGEDWKTRGPRLDEQVELLRALWGQQVVDYSGRFHRIDRAGIEPRPRREIPLWFGGHGEVAWRRAARVGDGVIIAPGRGNGPEVVERLRGIVREAGRDPDAFGVDAIVRVRDPDWQEQVAGWRAAGATHVSLDPMGAGFDSPAAQIEAVAHLAEAAGAR